MDVHNILHILCFLSCTWLAIIDVIFHVFVMYLDSNNRLPILSCTWMAIIDCPFYAFDSYLETFHCNVLLYISTPL